MSLSNYIRRTKGEDREDINRLLGVMSDIFYPEPEEGSVQERIVLGVERRIRTLSLTSGVVDVTTAETRDKYAVDVPRLQMPTACESYPLIHTTNGTFTNAKTTNTKYGGGLIYDGSVYITIDDHSNLKPIDSISWGGWFYLIKTSNTQHIIKMQESNTPYNLRITGSDVLRGRIRTDNGGGTTYNVDISAANWTDNQWNSIILTWKGTPENRLRIYLNGSQQGGDVTTVGALQYSGSDGLGIGAGPLVGGNTVTNLTKMAWVMLFHEELSSTWVTGFNNGFFDWSGGNQITCIPFVGDETVWAEATTPFCISS